MAQTSSAGKGKTKRAPEKPRPESNARRDLVQNRLFEVSTEIFAERGYGATSLQDIAEAMGISRPALYYYVKSKEEILDRLLEEFPLRDAEILRDVAARGDLAPVEQLRAVVMATIARTAQVPERFRMLDRCEHHLSKPAAKKYDRARREVLRTFMGIVERGMANGSFRAVDPRTAALAILGMCNWVAWWYKPEDGPVEDIGSEIADLAVASVVAADGSQTSATSILSSIRGDLDRLEKQI